MLTLKMTKEFPASVSSCSFSGIEEFCVYFFDVFNQNLYVFQNVVKLQNFLEKKKIYIIESDESY